MRYVSDGFTVNVKTYQIRCRKRYTRSDKKFFGTAKLCRSGAGLLDSLKLTPVIALYTVTTPPPLSVLHVGV